MNFINYSITIAISDGIYGRNTTKIRYQTHMYIVTISHKFKLIFFLFLLQKKLKKHSTTRMIWLCTSHFFSFLLRSFFSSRIVEITKYWVTLKTEKSFLISGPMIFFIFSFVGRVLFTFLCTFCLQLLSYYFIIDDWEQFYGIFDLKLLINMNYCQHPFDCELLWIFVDI